MAVQANLVINDGQVAPVAKTFQASGVRPDPSGGTIAVWKDKTTGIAIGFPTITVSFRESSAKTDVDKRIMLPSLEVISGSDAGYTPSPKVAYTLMSREQFVLPARSTTANRRDLLAFSKNLNADAVMTNAVHNYESVW